jgi:hypothetical protein
VELRGIQGEWSLRCVGKKKLIFVGYERKKEN